MKDAIKRYMRRLAYHMRHDGRSAADFGGELARLGAAGDVYGYVARWCASHHYVDEGAA